MNLLIVAAVLLTVVAVLFSDNQAAAAEVHTLENEFMKLVFDEQGAVVEIYNKKTHTRYTRPRGWREGPPSVPFVVDAYSANGPFYIEDPQEEQSGGFPSVPLDVVKDKPGDLVHLTGSRQRPPRISVSREGPTQSIECAYELAGGVRLTYTVNVREGDPLSEWRVKVENGFAPDPKEELRVYRVAFPVLDRLRIGGNPVANWLARPYAQGELIPAPAEYSFRRKWGPTNVLTYPGWASMAWMDLYKPQPQSPHGASGLYLASYDPTFQQIDLEAFPDHRRKTMTLDVRTYAYLEPGESWESQRFMVGIHEGDWHWGADRYREDSAAWLKRKNIPQWINDCDGWFGSGGPNYSFSDLPEMLQQARWLGLNYLQCWSQMLEKVGPNKSRKNYYCFFLPDIERGGEAGLAEAVKKVRQMGGHIGFYSNLWTFDATAPEGILQWKDQIPSDAWIPDWNKEFKRYASVFPDGHVIAADYLHGYSGMCPAAEGWQDYLKFWIVDKYVKQYGVDAWYMDSCPVTMFGASRICFSQTHGPRAPHGVGRGILQLLKKLREGAADTTNLAISSETICDCLMIYQSHALGIELVEGMSCYRCPDIYTYTFPHHPIFSGSSNNWLGVAEYYDDLDEPKHEDALDRVFLMGFRFDVPRYPLDKKDPFFQYLRSLIALRKRIKGDLYRSSFKHTVGLGELPHGVEARLFRHDEGSSLTITFLDRRENKDAFTLDVDAARHGVDGLSKATLYTLDGGEVDVRVESLDDGRIRLVVPGREGIPAAVILRK